MGDKRAWAGTTAKNPRKASRLEPLAAADSGRGPARGDAGPLEVSNPREEATAAASGSERCGHYIGGSALLETVLLMIRGRLSSKDKYAAICEHCRDKTNGRKAAGDEHCLGRTTGRTIAVGKEFWDKTTRRRAAGGKHCRGGTTGRRAADGGQHCRGGTNRRTVAGGEQFSGRTTERRAAGGVKEDAGKQQLKEASVEAKQESSSVLVCLCCARHFCGAAKTKPHGHARQHAKKEQHWLAASYNEPDAPYCFQCEKKVSIKMLKEEAAGAIVVNDKEHGHASGLAKGHGYGIRGLRNLGNTCYLNVLVQCLLVLDNLRARMLGPDAPTGSLGMALKELFVETNGANNVGGVLNPRKLLAQIRSKNSQFKGNGMNDCHELLCSLRIGLDEEEKLKKPPGMQKVAPSAVVPTVIDSIFGVQLSFTVSCKCCSVNSVSHVVYHDLSVLLPSKGPPAKSVALPPRNKSDRPQRKIHKKPPEPLEVDSTEADNKSLASIEDYLALYFKPVVLERYCENCSKVAERQGTNKSKDGEQMMASTNKYSAVDGDQTEQTDRKTCQNEQSSDLNSLAVECTSSSRQPHGSHAQHQVIHTVDRIDKGITSGMSCGEKNLASCSTANKEPECHERVQKTVASCFPTEKQTNLLSAQDSQNASPLNQGRGKQVKLDRSALQVDENQNGKKDRNVHAIQTCLISKLPPVLTIHLVRSTMGLLKVRGHVSFKEFLDVGLFMDPRSENKDNSRYRLVGVIEHRSPSASLREGHYVAYVRASHQQQSSGSSSWFCASDNNIKEVSLEKVFKCEAYVLFYERTSGIQLTN